MNNGSCDQELEAAPEAHAVELAVWNVPPTTVAGERFAVSVGARCSAGCDLSGRELIMVDQAGSPAGSVKLGHTTCPNTEALYFAAVEATAPLEPGSHRWEARVAGWGSQRPHVSGAFPLVVRVVAAPDCQVVVRAVDRETQTAIAGARVVMHPYRAVTDANGIAKIAVARGRYDILVSASRYLQTCSSVEVSADLATSAELDADRPWESPDEGPE